MLTRIVLIILQLFILVIFDFNHFYQDMILKEKMQHTQDY